MKINLKMVIGQLISVFLLFALALFLPAGTIAWPAGWTFLGLFFGFMLLLNLWLLKHNPGLLQERMRGRAENQQPWDKVLFPTMLLLFFAWLSVMGIDAALLHWSHVPFWLQIVGGIILLGSFYLLFLTFRENSYLSPVVRIQEERGQTVVSTGPYHYVRHPMYAAIVIFVIGASLLLGSCYGLLMGLAPLAILARRVVLEERTLRANLNGYTNYTTQVRHRIVPYVW
ncbi:MAG: isoprenylcysteine carboxylmethyltransferase family protein [Caldilineaceae bacterium]